MEAYNREVVQFAKYLTVIPSLSYLQCSWCYVTFGHLKINTSGTSRHHEEAVSHHAVLFYYISQQGDDSLPHLNRSENIHLFLEFVVCTAADTRDCFRRSSQMIELTSEVYNIEPNKNDMEQHV